MADAFVRPARTSDLAAVAEAQAAAWRASYAAILPAAVLDGLDPLALAAGWATLLAAPPDPRARLLVAAAGAQVAGYAATGPSGDPDARPDDGELAALVVHPRWRRQGHGSRLLAAAVDHLASDGFAAIGAWVPLADRPLQEFLASAGWAADGARRDLAVDAAGATLAEVRLVTAL